MHLDYHIPVPFLAPTAAELLWAEKYLIPHANVALAKVYEKYGPKFDKSNVDQDLLKSWTLAQRMQAHIESLGLTLRRFALFIGYQGAKYAAPHIDAQYIKMPMVARLNVPIQGQHGARLSWWNATIADPRIKERLFEEWDGKINAMRQGFVYRADSSEGWEEPVHVEIDPGPCWNHVELAHRLDLDDTTEHRINITAELDPQITWVDLVNRLRQHNYIVLD